MEINRDRRGDAAEHSATSGEDVQVETAIADGDHGIPTAGAGRDDRTRRER